MVKALGIGLLDEGGAVVVGVECHAGWSARLSVRQDSWASYDITIQLIENA